MLLHNFICTLTAHNINDSYAVAKQKKDEMPPRVLLHPYTTPIYYTHILHPYTAPIYYTHILHPYTTSIYHIHILHPYTAPIYYTHILHPYTTPIYYTHILHPYTTPIYYTHILHPYTTPICVRGGGSGGRPPPPGLKNFRATLFFRASASCSKILNHKNTYSAQWIQGTLCFSG